MTRHYMCKYESPLGKMTLASDGEALTGVWFDGQKYYASSLSECAEEAVVPVLEQTVEWLDCYFSGGMPHFMPALRLCGSPFRLAVWRLLQMIPYGAVVTYGDLAKEVARLSGVRTMSAQAIGGAVGHNPVSILVPCHRVVGGDGSLTGYAGGLTRKAELLQLEGTDPLRVLERRRAACLIRQD